MLTMLQDMTANMHPVDHSLESMTLGSAMVLGGVGAAVASTQQGRGETNDD
ncbi:hypothetical protein GALL_484900 [mine drainage metagenome]|uniref:Uncharacterized protein n=1 Tax=mine drainage metagenome TaxID=410659 RepID=A0A1J5PQ65_9ZZZZ